MNINLNNFQAYFLDYHEGTLSPSLEKELIEFVAAHPELKQEFENFEPITLMDSEGILFEQKDKLKKQLSTINSSNFDEYAVDYIEGTLPISLQKDLQTFTSQNPAFKKQLELYTKTKLQPDTSLVFDDKFSLKRNQKRPAALYYWSAAASVAIFVVAYFMLHKNGNKISNSIVKQEQLKESNVLAKQTTEGKDTNSGTANNIASAPANAVKNNTNQGNITIKKHHENRIVTPANMNSGAHSTVANRSAIDIYSLPGLAQQPIPFYLENSFTTPLFNLQDTGIINEWIMKNNVNVATQEEDTTAVPYKEKSGGKFLFTLAKITCKGLHIITGQHIRMEKKFDPDTTNIIAYQLDLGKKTYDFPVKE